MAVSAAASALALVPRGGAPEPAVQDGDRFVGIVAEATTPPLYIEGQPFMGELTIVAEPGDRPAEVPAHLLEPSGWSLDGKALVRRRAGDARFVLQQGQRLETSIDLAPFIEDRLDGDGRDFRIQFVETARVLEDTVHLALPEAGIDFMELPREQLGGYQVVLDTDGGLIWLELWPEVAPNHVRNFLDLCATGFYDGLVFNRVIPGFMVQGGRPKAGTAAPRTVDAEFSDRPHDAGVLSAARGGNDINSATSEFFIIHRASRELDGKYSAFGRVLLGMDAVESIVRGADVHTELIRKMLEKEIDVETGDSWFDFVVNEPNPPQVIRQALVVKATKSRR
ncbi:MAG: peptidylprolyl isomerase [Planctomycetota bacterium]